MVDHLNKLKEFTEAHLFLQLLNKPSHLSTKLDHLSKTCLFEQQSETYTQLHKKPATPSDLPTLGNKDSFDSALEELRSKVNNSLKLKEDLLDTELSQMKQLSKLEYERGNYEKSEKLLEELRRDDYRELWGELVLSVLLNKIDKSKSIVEDLVQDVSDLKSKAWLLHTALFVSFPHCPGLFSDILNENKFVNTVEVACPHLARYLVASTLLKKTGKILQIFQGFAKVLRLDPGLAAFVEYFEDYDEEKALSALDKFQEIVREDYFLAGFEKELLKEARKFFVFCRLQINKSVDVQWIERTVGDKVEKVLEELESEYKTSFSSNGKYAAKVRKNH